MKKLLCFMIGHAVGLPYSYKELTMVGCRRCEAIIIQGWPRGRLDLDCDDFECVGTGLYRLRERET